MFSLTEPPSDGGRKRLLWMLLLLVSVLLLLWQTVHWGRYMALNDLQKSADNELQRYRVHLQGQLEKYAFLPGVLASNRRLVFLLQNPGDKERIDALNRYLEAVNRITGTSDTYLMDAGGLTIAASNWHSERPFVGRNFSYRPYFQEAMKGHLGRYFALGTTSKKRGYYFAYPVRYNSAILGAVVIKINMAPIESSWTSSDAEFLVTDPDGVIFITTRKSWRYRSLETLSSEVTARIRNSRRYGDVALNQLPMNTVEVVNPAARVVRIQEGRKGIKYLLQEVPMPQAGWKIHILSRLDQVNQQVWRALIFAALLLTAIFLSILFWLQRRRRLLDRARFERQAKQLLQIRVKEQTRDLIDSNSRLKQEIEEHRRTGDQLQHTQAELIQAAKLAVIGQLSTGISHELNQPLAAIRSYADNARALQQKGRLEDVSWNLQQISELTERMAQISSQLKQFARKSSGQKGSVLLSAVVENSLKILASRLKESRVEMHVELPDQACYLLADMVQLEQVLVNLIGNAIHAVEGAEQRVITVSAELLEKRVSIQIHDSGDGIADEHIGRIFDPFFTTKDEGRGLGLGLSISQRIVEVMNGTLSACNHPQGGALFTLELPRSAPPGDETTGNLQ